MAKKKTRSTRTTRTTPNAHVAKNTILTVIVLAMLTVIGFTLYNFIATPEFLVKREIESIASDYYENYFYNKIIENNSNDPNAISEALEKYTDKGFARLSLRQLLLYDNAKHAASSKYLSEYCSLDSTLLKIYPDSPFGRKNYHVDYSYSCKF